MRSSDATIRKQPYPAARGAEEIWAGLVREVRKLILASGPGLDDRRILETVILPYCAGNEAFERILFVGCAWYTRSYVHIFRHAEFWTVDPDLRKARHGAARHLAASIADIELHFRHDSLDLIICNGVCGWGLDERDEAERALSACHRCLRRGGLLIFGWNDLPARRPLLPEQSRSLRLFRRHVFAPLGASRWVTRSPRRHVYDFYEK